MKASSFTVKKLFIGFVLFIAVGGLTYYLLRSSEKAEPTLSSVGKIPETKTTSANSTSNSNDSTIIDDKSISRDLNPFNEDGDEVENNEQDDNTDLDTESLDSAEEVNQPAEKNEERTMAIDMKKSKGLKNYIKSLWKAHDHFAKFHVKEGDGEYKRFSFTRVKAPKWLEMLKKFDEITKKDWIIPNPRGCCWLRTKDLNIFVTPSPKNLDNFDVETVRYYAIKKKSRKSP